MENKDIIVYGAYGYTGELIVRKCQELGIRPLLSGRNESKLKPIAEQYGSPYQVADLKADELDKLLAGAKVVIHAAGPFIHTSKPMVEACIRNKVHYTDITGEIAVFAQARKYDEQAIAAGVMLLPGTGFDVVPSDCLAAHLKSRMEDADDLVLAFHGTGRASRGTSLTVVEGLGFGGTIRKDGKLKQVPDAYDVKRFDFGGTKMSAVTIPANATMGLTRLRVQATGQSIAPDVCGTYNLGETEDFCVNVTMAVGLTNAQNSTWSVFPNPATDRLQIAGLSGNASYRITAADGREVMIGTISGSSHTLDCSGLIPGAYAISIISDNEVGIIRFVKR